MTRDQANHKARQLASHLLRRVQETGTLIKVVPSADDRAMIYDELERLAIEITSEAEKARAL
jgi:hypothetical protein